MVAVDRNKPGYVLIVHMGWTGECLSVREPIWSCTFRRWNCRLAFDNLTHHCIRELTRSLYHAKFGEQEPARHRKEL